MTEADWVVCTSLQPTIQFLQHRISDRKLRLCMVAICRDLWPRLNPRSRPAVEVAERFADGLATEAELDQIHSAAVAACRDQMGLPGRYGHLAATKTAALPVELDGAISALVAAGWDALKWTFTPDFTEEMFHEEQKAARHAKEKKWMALIHDISGNPFRPITLAPGHRTPTVVSLTRAAYDERHLPSGELDPNRLAVLADALEETGAPGELVAHLRGPGPHVRGCHVVDLVLGLS